ncbi:MAG: hypothetical protein JRI68_27365 [Deltaproteobacteria bacterium]|nr:hypothetical protein [Deltaproteobacteria bacterium]
MLELGCRGDELGSVGVDDGHGQGVLDDPLLHLVGHDQHGEVLNPATSRRLPAALLGPVVAHGGGLLDALTHPAAVGRIDGLGVVVDRHLPEVVFNALGRIEQDDLTVRPLVGLPGRVPGHRQAVGVGRPLDVDGVRIGGVGHVVDRVGILGVADVDVARLGRSLVVQQPGVVIRIRML